MKRRERRLQRTDTELDITAFLNLMVILIPFLLITAVFSRVTVLDLYLPPESQLNSDTQKKFRLEVVIRENRIYLNEASSRLNESFALNKENLDYSKLVRYLVELKKKFPDKREISILAESDIEYDILVQVMDHVRMREVRLDGEIILQDLFPGISIGDAPKRLTGQGK